MKTMLDASKKDQLVRQRYAWEQINEMLDRKSNRKPKTSRYVSKYSHVKESFARGAKRRAAYSEKLRKSKREAYRMSARRRAASSERKSKKRASRMNVDSPKAMMDVDLWGLEEFSFLNASV